MDLSVHCGKYSELAHNGIPSIFVLYPFSENIFASRVGRSVLAAELES